MMEQDYLELYELQQIIREGVEEAVPDSVRVRAEVASIQQKGNGHCYLELCQSDTRGPVAKVRAIIWRSQAAELLGKFAQATGAPLQPGVAVIFQVSVNYSELYGVSLIVEDIDVSATVGEAELRRRRTLERLEKEGLLDLQKELVLPEVPYSLAVISAADAAGYGDFRRHLLENEYGFAFEVKLYPAIMQGDSAPSSIIAALELAAASNPATSVLANTAAGSGLRPRELEGDAPRQNSCYCDSSNAGPELPSPVPSAERPDAILILRGGGSSLDLACFDDYDLCAAIARCPVPVCTAIGHDRDEHAADLVANVAVKTPTALADLFIDAVAAEDERISSFQNRLRMAFSYKLSALEAAVDMLETRIKAANPRKLLERGYTLITNGKGILLKRAADINAGDGIFVLYPDGTLNCTVNGKV